MYEAYLREISLPPEFLIKDYIPGEPDCNYEKYVLEFLNASEWFMEKTGGISFCHLKNGKGGMNSMLFDFGAELQGGIQVVTGGAPANKVKLRVRFGESAS